ncbi:gephyrin-like molybdotransferase Glp [Bacillus taeanensis]|uniref:Molybdopterin molybdenumtransferase n=1 Tax=Bacillus taeanensis TaxID=273032 RepID=A0A366XUF1_9BACI|nr:gephyrin-like molybdotransferase Glp [Bacillus taeanensis]RBW69527.1 molybdopterin molybdenumtransferase MoeA [Bacillus taeanensis]
MVERRKPIPVSEAVKRVMNYPKQGEVEFVSLQDSDNRYLGHDLAAAHDVPPFDRSPYDGFAVRAEDTSEASANSPIALEVIEEIGAGAVPKYEVKKGQATRIMTGAILPKGADAVVMLELVKEVNRDKKDFIQLKRSFQSGDNISFQGEDVKKGTPLVKKGTKITPGVKALLATFGYAKVPVVKKPVIGIYATGTELLDVNEPLQSGKIRNSNSFMIEAQIKRAGAIPKYFGKLADDFEPCYEAIKEALEEVDFLITTGGVSVGDFDYLPAIYKKLHAEVLFNKVAMRPGSVTTVAVLGEKVLFGLSGNPSACYVGFELFVRPLIKSYLLSEKAHLLKANAVLKSDFLKPNPFTRFVRSAVLIEEGKLVVNPTGLDKSNVVTSLAEANSLIMLPGGTRGFEKGSAVEVLLLEEEGSRSTWE